MPFLSLLFMLCVLSGCTGYQDPDFNKPLIVLSQDTDIQQNAVTTQNNDPQQNEAAKPKSPEDQAWVEAKTRRIWVSPRSDENGDYVQGYYKYIVIDPGHWSLNGNEAKQ